MFRGGREFAAWLGLVPRQSSTGGKARLGGISKRGDGYLRRLLVNSAHTVLLCSKAAKVDPWLTSLRGRKLARAKNVMAQSVDPTDREKPGRLRGIQIPTN